MSKHSKENIKMNLTLKRDFFMALKELAEGDHLKTATWVKQFLMRKVNEHLANNQ